MIYVSAHGSNEVRRKFTESITWWFIDKQLSRYKNLNISIDITKIDDAQGTCVYDDDTFHIEVDPTLKGGNFIECLLHELIHVEQHLKDLYEINDDHEHIPYVDRLFEQDAYTRSELLCQEYINKEWIAYARRSTKIRDLVA
tara:strand:- start:157 stop:582 length:426 start_codon:yes stop_codon:yes gene_type:complete